MLARALGLFLVLATARCTLIADADLKAGIGRPCGKNEDCQASICDRGLCTIRCSEDAECALPSLCFDGMCSAGCKLDTQCAANEACLDRTCKPTTRVAALLPGAAGGEDGWTTSHKQGLDEATTKHASVLKF